jgi:nucleoside-diphosphate-sugar epimerase
MRIFVTGATGFVGSAVVQELIGAGHEVLALVRSDAGAKQLKAWGADVHRGDLEDLDQLARGAASADGVIHCAFNHDFSRFEANSAMDRRAIDTLGGALEGSERPLIVTSGLALLAPGRLALESDEGPQPTRAFPRASEAAAAALAARGVHAAVVRLPPSVHGEGDHGFVPILVRLAQEKRAAAYIGEGRNRWAAVHRLDAARVYRLAIERGAADGPYHAIAEEGIPFREIAGAIGRGIGVPVESKSGDAAKEYFAWFEMFAGMDLAGSSARTRALLGWEPTRPGLLDDIANAGYV